MLLISKAVGVFIFMMIQQSSTQRPPTSTQPPPTEDDPHWCAYLDNTKCGEEDISTQCKIKCAAVTDPHWCAHIDIIKCKELHIASDCKSKCDNVSGSIDGHWSEWSSWGTCSAPCGGGQRRRFRDCTGPPPSNGGRPCPGEKMREEYCNAGACSINGGWSAWGSWDSCSASCGGGQRRRYRDCNKPAPAHGGQVCSGSDNRVDNCNTEACPKTCSELEGFKLPGSRQCLVWFGDTHRTWDEADAKCKSLGLVLAKPRDAVAVRRFIVQNYNSVGFTWCGGRGDGSRVRWVQGNTAVTTGWLPGEPEGVSSNDCLVMTTRSSSLENYPDTPYVTDSCSYSYSTLCEVV